MVKGNRNKPSVDRISSLPDSLLVEIISLSSPDTKRAIRTGILSKQWRHLWPQVRDIIIEHESLHVSSQIFSSIQRIISKSDNLNKFKLHAHYTNEAKSKVNKCICNAIDHNVQEVDINFTLNPVGSSERFVLPEFFFISSSFIHLKLSGCTLGQVGIITWKNLKTLSINAYLNEDMIANILSGSPLLETLELDRCYGFKRIDVTNKSVKNLVLSWIGNLVLSWIGNSEDVVEINAPYILSLAIKGHLVLEDLALLNVSSVIKAELDYFRILPSHWPEELHEEMLKGLILSLGHVKEVIIGESCSQALNCLKVNGFIYPSNLKVFGEVDSS